MAGQEIYVNGLVVVATQSPRTFAKATTTPRLDCLVPPEELLALAVAGMRLLQIKTRLQADKCVRQWLHTWVC